MIEQNTRTWVLGAPDPEMERIEASLVAAGEIIAYAMCDGRRVHPGNTYRADDCTCICPGEQHLGPTWGAVTHLVECGAVAEAALRDDVVRIDHHKPGDPGYGRPPAEFLPASSIGQVLAELARLGALSAELMGSVGDVGRAVDPGEMIFAGWWRVGIGHDPFDVPMDIVLCAAADHCLRVAYADDAPGVDPTTLMAWRIAQRAAHQGVDVDDLSRQVDETADLLIARVDRAIIEETGWAAVDFFEVDHETGALMAHQGDASCEEIWTILYFLLDVRGPVVPELPEAATRYSIPYIAGPLSTPDGREKIVVSGPPPTIARFLAGKILPELKDRYGDPARGFAGGYI